MWDDGDQLVKSKTEDGGGGQPEVRSDPPISLSPPPAGFLAGTPRPWVPGRCPCALPQPAAPQSPPGGQRRLLLHHDRGRAGQRWQRGGG